MRGVSECVTPDSSFQHGAQLGGLVALPFAGIYVAVGSAHYHSTSNPLLISAVLLAIDAILFYVSTARLSQGGDIHKIEVKS